MSEDGQKIESSSESSGSMQQLEIKGSHASIEFKLINYDEEKDKLLKFLMDELKSVKKDLHSIKNDKIEKFIGIPKKELEELGIIREQTKEKKKKSIPLLQSEIEEAFQKAGSANSAAKLLGCSYEKYRKYAKMYGIFKINATGKGIKRPHRPDIGKYPLSEILQGKHPNLIPYKVKDRLIRGKVKKPECENCGYKNRRVDGKIPLILNFIDGDQKNHKIENMQILCYNCAFTIGRGFIKTGKKWFDPDILQGSDEIVDARF